MRTFLKSLITSILLVGCTDAAQPSDSSIPELGIARIAINDGAQETIVRGLDATGVEVARLDLIHGTFHVTAPFREYFGDGLLVGRKIDVTLHGEPHLSFETSGFDPILHMPAHPASERELAIFLEDPTVKPVLERWGLGWDVAPLADTETEYTIGTITGSSPFDCSSPATTCGSTIYGTMNTCGGGGVAAYSAKRINTSAATGSEYKIAQCCPPVTGGPSTDWFATKACSTNPTAQVCNYKTGTNNGVMTSCGCQSNALGCVGCASYPFYQSCGVTSTPSALNYCSDAQEGDACNPLHGTNDCCGQMYCDSSWHTCAYCITGGGGQTICM